MTTINFELPSCGPMAAGEALPLGAASFRIDAPLTAAVLALAAREGVTARTVLMTAVVGLCARYSGE